MEEGVVNEIMKSPLRDVFDHKQLISDVSGSGNNWYVRFWIASSYVSGVFIGTISNSCC